MRPNKPSVSVVVATHNRPARLRDLLASLREQRVAADAFEVIVVDDASDAAGTAEVLADAERQTSPVTRVVRRERRGGPAIARNAGWREALGAVVAFTDDDCVVHPDWLRAGLAACAANPGAIVQGRTDPIPEEAHKLSPFARSQAIHGAGPAFETCNIFYPRRVLEALDGFDESYGPRGGEDTDLAWRAKANGAAAIYAPRALVFHAVVEAGAAGMFRHALRWQETVRLFARHPELRAAQLRHGIFWSPSHEHLIRFLLAIPLARRSRLLALALAWPYLVRLTNRRSGPLLAPFLLAYDLVETYAIVRGALRNRVLVV